MDDIQKLKEELRKAEIEHLRKFGLDEKDAVFAMNAIEGGCPIGDLMDCLPENVDVVKVKRFLLEKRYAELALQKKRMEQLRDLNDSLMRVVLSCASKIPSPTRLEGYRKSFSEENNRN